MFTLAHMRKMERIIKSTTDLHGRNAKTYSKCWPTLVRSTKTASRIIENDWRSIGILSQNFFQPSRSGHAGARSNDEWKSKPEFKNFFIFNYINTSQ